MRPRLVLAFSLALIATPALIACKTDPAPAASDRKPLANTTNARPRQAKLPAPTNTNALIIGVQLRAEMAWNDATAANTPEAWDLAADLFARAYAACRVDCRELAYADVLARSNALKTDPMLVRPAEKPTTPQPLPARVEAFVDAADTYAATAPPGDDDAIGVSFLAGQQYNDYGWIDESTTRFATIVIANPTHEVALYSANLMLDAFNRSGRYDDLLRWARDLRANAALMAAQPELAELVQNLIDRAGRAN
jgi:hypothetical protein